MERRANPTSRPYSWPRLGIAGAVCLAWPVIPSAPGVALGQEQPAGAPATAPVVSDAERVARLRKAIEEGQARLAELQAKLVPPEQAPEGELAKSEAAFRAIDEERKGKQAQLDAANEEGRRADAEKFATELEEVQSRWQLVKDRFDLALKEYKTLQEQAVTVDARLKQDQQALAALMAPPPPKPAPATQTPTATPAPAGAPGPAAPATPAGGTGQGTPATTPPASPAGEGAAQAAPPQQPAPSPPAVLAPGVPMPGPAADRAPPKPPSQEVVRAQERAQEKEAEARQAEHAVRSVEERLALLRQQIKTERELLSTAQRQADLAQQEEATLDEQVRTKREAGEPYESYRALADAQRDATRRKDHAVGEADEHASRVDALQSEMAALHEEQISALREAEGRREEASRAQDALATLTDPYSLQNIRGWLFNRAPRVLGIIIGMALLLWGTRKAQRRLVMRFARQAERGTLQERVNRARTLTSVFHNAFTVATVVIATIMILTEFGVNAGPLLGGAAVVGLAVAFGAQNLIRDFFSGFMILLENQYGIGDVVKLGGVAGLVENVSLRVTELRDLEGVVHFVPNGEIKVVSNMTHGWSRALFDIGVAYKEDVDRVMEVLVELGTEMRREPDWRHMILEKPQMLGVDSFGDSSVVIKFFIKTKPLKQWDVKRELLRRIKNRFDELGIEIPFPHRTVFHRYESAVPVEMSGDGAAAATGREHQGV